MNRNKYNQLIFICKGIKKSKKELTESTQTCIFLITGVKNMKSYQKAFPGETSDELTTIGNSSGMDIRMYIAVQAMNGMLANSELERKMFELLKRKTTKLRLRKENIETTDIDTTIKEITEDLCKAAFNYADIMLKISEGE